MNLIVEKRGSDSPYVKSITRGHTLTDAAVTRPSESHWHMVFTRFHGGSLPILVGPLESAGTAAWQADAEILWIQFKLGTYMPHLPMHQIAGKETLLPKAAGTSFWLHGSAWQFPDFENVDSFVDRLVRHGILAYDPLVQEVLARGTREVPERTVRHRFRRATGLRQSTIRQMERAQKAAELIQRGTPILDTVFEAGYFDQPHLTRALKQWIGFTPAQLLPASAGT